MSQEYLESILKDLYKSEADRSDKLDSVVNLPTAILTVLLGVGALYLDSPPKFRLEFPVVAFYVISLVYFILLASALFCLVRSYFGYKYRMLADPQEVVNYESTLRKYFTDYPVDGSSTDDEVARALRSNVIQQYREAADHNRRANLRRINWLFWTTGLIVSALVAMIISKVLYVAIRDTVPKPYDVKIVQMPATPKLGVAFPNVQTIEIDTDSLVNLVNPPKLKVLPVTEPRKIQAVDQPQVPKTEITKPTKGDK
jgi:hypothetical protein